MTKKSQQPIATPPQFWVWVDMEMTGLDPEVNQIIEVALVITDTNLEILAEAPVQVIHQPEEILLAMDDWNKSTHKKTNLWQKVLESSLTLEQAERNLLDFLSPWTAKSSPMCGNTICQDRRFMAKHMPKLEAWFHYRNIDVSTLKELARAWEPAIIKGFSKKSAHTALADIKESIDEMQFYRKHFINNATSQDS